MARAEHGRGGEQARAGARVAHGRGGEQACAMARAEHGRGGERARAAAKGGACGRVCRPTWVPHQSLQGGEARGAEVSRRR